MKKLFLFLSILIAGACSDNNLVGPPEPEPGKQPDSLAPDTIQDNFIQRTAASSDILFIVDDSCSMGEEQNALISNFAYFSQFILGSGLDYHIGVLRGDLSQNTPGQLVGTPTYIDSSTSNASSNFSNKISSLGDSGMGSCETGLAGIYYALTPPMINGYNVGFYRPEAMLTVVVITDEPEQGCNCRGSFSCPNEWVDWIIGLKGSPDLITFGAIAGFSTSNNRTASSCSSSYGNASAAPRLENVANQLNGITWSICNQDWSYVMTELGLAAAGLTRSFNLSRVPSWDYDDWDADGVTQEPVLKIKIDRLDGNGWVTINPSAPFSSNPDPINPWTYNREKNSVDFLIENMPDEDWKIKALYPNSEEL